MIPIKASSVFVYLSPAGSTRRVAKTLAQTLKGLGLFYELFDLAKPGRQEQALAAVESMQQGDCLWVGSPVYVSHPLPNVLDFIKALPAKPGCLALPFVTYGAVTSGVALLDMANILEKKQFGILGGAKVVAAHSMMWPGEEPLGKGRPDARDEDVIRELAAKAAAVFLGDVPAEPVGTTPFHYQGAGFEKQAAGRRLADVQPMMLPIQANAETCIQCGSCQDACPNGNITLDDFPCFGGRCLTCFECVHACETGTLTAPAMAAMEPHIRQRAIDMAEPAETRIYWK